MKEEPEGEADPFESRQIGPFVCEDSRDRGQSKTPTSSVERGHI